MFHEVLFQMMKSIRSNRETRGKPVILFMDNAKFHHHSKILELCQRMRVNVLFNAQYSPWLNPIELFFGYVKR